MTAEYPRSPGAYHISAAAVAAVSAGVNRPRSSSSDTIGRASTIRPTVAGTFSISIMRSPLEIVRRIAPASAATAWRAMSGSAAVAIEMPKSPIGRYISLNA